VGYEQRKENETLARTVFVQISQIPMIDLIFMWPKNTFSLFSLVYVPSSAMTQTDRLSWDDYFMCLALLSAKRSKDPQTQVGACIVSRDRKIVGIGYNGFPHLGPVNNDECLPWGREGSGVSTKYPFVCHAEMNAVMNKNQQDVSGCTIYSTLFPCHECAKILIQSGIKEVVYLSDSKASQPTMQASRSMLCQAGVSLRQHVTNEIRVPLSLDEGALDCFYLNRGCCLQFSEILNWEVD
jgi:dCMP deaminase